MHIMHARVRSYYFMQMRQTVSTERISCQKSQYDISVGLGTYPWLLIYQLSICSTGDLFEQEGKKRKRNAKGRSYVHVHLIVLKSNKKLITTADPMYTGKKKENPMSDVEVEKKNPRRADTKAYVHTYGNEISGSAPKKDDVRRQGGNGDCYVQFIYVYGYYDS